MTIAKVSLNALLKEIWPFLIGLLVALALITYLPGLSLWLPRLLGP
jgi:TRAP-type C4-dicarboxylate transport system permease large subunit